MKVSSIFISKNQEEIEEISAYCNEHEITLKAQSFIEFEAISGNFLPQHDIYFFGSKNAFDFFLQLNHSLENKKIAVIGQSTKAYIEKKGLQVNFFGKEAGNPKAVAEDLIQWLDGDKISFFQSDLSKRSVADALPEDQKEEFVIYKTILKKTKIDGDFNCYIFTSPSNVEAFLSFNKVPGKAIVISWGKSTDKTLEKHSIRATYTLKNSSQEEVLEILKTKTL